MITTALVLGMVGLQLLFSLVLILRVSTYLERENAALRALLERFFEKESYGSGTMAVLHHRERMQSVDLPRPTVYDDRNEEVKTVEEEVYGA